MREFLVTLIFFVFNFSTLYSQEIKYKEVKALSNEKVLVVLNKNDETNYSDALKLAVEKYWKISKYEFVYKEDLEKRFNKRYAKANLLGYFVIDHTRVNYTWANLPVFGLSNKYKKPGVIGYHYEGAYDFYQYMPFAAEGFAEDEIQAYLNLYVGILNEAFTVSMKTAKNLSLWELEEKNTLSYDKPLIVNKKDLFITDSELKRAYPHSFEIIDKEAYIKNIIDANDVYLFWTFFSGDGYYYYIVNPSTMHILEFDSASRDSNDNAQKKAQIKIFKNLSK